MGACFSIKAHKNVRVLHSPSNVIPIKSNRTFDVITTETLRLYRNSIRYHAMMKHLKKKIHPTHDTKMDTRECSKYLLPYIHV
jgi:hypothetical protein